MGLDQIFLFCAVLVIAVGIIWAVVSRERGRVRRASRSFGGRSRE